MVSFIFYELRREGVSGTAFLSLAGSELEYRKKIYFYPILHSACVVCGEDLSIDKKKQLSETHQRWQVR